MLLPFLKPKKASSTVYTKTEGSDSLMSIAETLLKHIKEDDATGVAECLSRFEKLDEAEDATD